MHEITATNPVEHVNCHESASVMAAHGLALPTEAQWEYACRAGTSTPWATGDRPETLAGFENIADRTAQLIASQWTATPSFEDRHVVHAPVGSFRANAFGLFDTQGNVGEWCRDAWAGYARTARDGDGLRATSGAARVVRGGSYRRPAWFARSAHRSRDAAGEAFDSVGVRASRAIR